MGIVATHQSQFDPGLEGLVLDYDLAGVSTVGTDFIFDALNPLSYAAGVLPSVGVAIPASGIYGSVIFLGGSGGTNGTFALGISGGGGTGAAGTFTVAGGTITNVTITSPGTGYTSNPTVSYAASAGLSGVAVNYHLGSLFNLARNVQPVLSRTGRVTLGPVDHANRPTFDGKGLAFTNGVTKGLYVLKDGVLRNRANEPTLESFKDILEVVWIRTTGTVVNSSPYAASTNGGWAQNSGGGFNTRETSVAAIPAITVGALTMLAKLVRFNIGSNTSTITPFVGSAGAVSKYTPLAGRAPSAYISSNSGIAAIVGAFDAGSNSLPGVVYRFWRDYVGTSGLSDSEVLALLEREYAYGSARFA